MGECVHDSKVVMIWGDGSHEVGKGCNCPLKPGKLPALPLLVHRVLDDPSDVTYRCDRFINVHHGRERTRGFENKTRVAMMEARDRGCAGLVILVDQDRKTGKLRSLKAGRDDISIGYHACAVGAAVETFDAWMIDQAQTNAITQAGGDPTQGHRAPESLTGKERTGKHPKVVAASVFGSGKGLGQKYQLVAEHLDLALLKKHCPKGFASFADEIRDRIGSAISVDDLS